MFHNTAILGCVNAYTSYITTNTLLWIKAETWHLIQQL